MRVYELAKQLGMENRDLIPELKRMGIAVASHSSALEEESVQKALAKLGPKSKTSAKPSGHAAESGHDRPQRGKDTGHGSAAKAGSGHVAQVVEEPKPDKRRILIKRKKAEEGVAEEGAAAVAGAEPSGLITPSPESAGTLTITPHVDLPIAPHAEPMTRPAGTVQAPVQATAGAPTMVPTVEPVLGKKKSVAFESIEAEGLKDKLKKSRKLARQRDDEQVAWIHGCVRHEGNDIGIAMDDARPLSAGHDLAEDASAGHRKSCLSGRPTDGRQAAAARNATTIRVEHDGSSDRSPRPAASVAGRDRSLGCPR